jgi:hypothetical protein
MQGASGCHGRQGPLVVNLDRTSPSQFADPPVGSSADAHGEDARGDVVEEGNRFRIGRPNCARQNHSR